MATQFTSATDLCGQIKAGELSSVEALRGYIDQVERHDGEINAVVVRDYERALESASAADRRRAGAGSDTVGRLHGLPLTVKESFDICGLATTWGMKSRETNFSGQDAETVRRLRAAGAVIFGKTNVPDGLADHQASSSLFGITNNPWNVGLTCGGSSGGSAAALAAGFTSLELGSDLGGSLRVPAHFCGVYSHKPSFELISARGHSLDADSAPTDLTVVGPMARSVPDLRLMLEVLMGPDEFDSVGWQIRLPQARRSDLSQFRVAVLATHRACEIDRGIESSIRDLANDLRREGVRVDELAQLPIDVEACFQDYMLMTRSIALRRNPPELLKRLAGEAATLDPSDTSYRAATRRAAGMTHQDWYALNDRRQMFRARWRHFFESYDVLLCPVHASQAFPHNLQGERENRTLDVNGRPHDYNDSVFWMSIAGLNYLPATVRPVAIANGLPIGIQIIGPYLEDFTTLKFAELLERIRPRPAYPLER